MNIEHFLWLVFIHIKCLFLDRLLKECSLLFFIPLSLLANFIYMPRFATINAYNVYSTFYWLIPFTLFTAFALKLHWKYFLRGLNPMIIPKLLVPSLFLWKLSAQLLKCWIFIGTSNVEGLNKICIGRRQNFQSYSHHVFFFRCPVNWFLLSLIFNKRFRKELGFSILIESNMIT